jgi:hypothetical protein
MTKGSDLKWGCIIFVAAFLASAAALLPLTSGEEILLYTQQPYNFTNNRTLVAEDVDPHAGVVWLKLYSGNQTLKSALVGVGDRFGYNNTSVTVSKIYAGGDRDLVELEINNSNNDRNNNSNAINSSDRHNPLVVIENSSVNASTRNPASMKSPGFGGWAVLLAVLALRFIKAR